jgi:hypothetical protein
LLSPFLGLTKRFILFHGKRHPAQMGETEVSAFLTDLAVSVNVAGVTTQHHALNALVFLYKVSRGHSPPARRFAFPPALPPGDGPARFSRNARPENPAPAG